jgi:hypothetical protein
MAILFPNSSNISRVVVTDNGTSALKLISNLRLFLARERNLPSGNSHFRVTPWNSCTNFALQIPTDSYP